MNYFNYLLPGGQALQHFLPYCPFFDPANKIFDYLKIYVSLQQSQPDFTHSQVYIFCADFTFAPQLFKNIL
jgi:hypothetical protein